ncbi:MAG: GHKL domain-containing protein [Mycoplasmatota bacterium]
MQVISILIVSILSIFYNYYLNSRLLDDEKKLSVNNIVYAIFHVFLMSLIYMYVSSIIRIVISLLINIIFNKLYFSKSFIKSIISAIFTYIIIMMVEIVVIFFWFIFDKLILASLTLNIELDLIMNFIVVISCCLIINVHRLKNLLKKIINNIEVKIDKEYVMIMFLIFETVSLLGLFTYYNYNQTVNLIINYLIIVFFAIITYFLFKGKNDNIEICSKYKIASYNLREYEKLLTEQRILNHDTKNDFIVLRGMVEKNEKQEMITDYITELIKYRIKDNQDLLNQTSCIPLGGLQAIIYQKLLLAKEKKIKIFLNISKEIKRIKTLNLNVEELRSLCTIIGIFLDNSIEANDNVKNKEINVTMFLKNKKVYIKTSNTYSGHNVDEYSSKGIGRGNGLKIVNKLLVENQMFHNEKEIHGCVFQQTLIIDI